MKATEYLTKHFTPFLNNVKTRKKNVNIIFFVNTGKNKADR